MKKGVVFVISITFLILVVSLGNVQAEEYYKLTPCEDQCWECGSEPTPQKMLVTISGSSMPDSCKNYINAKGSTKVTAGSADGTYTLKQDPNDPCVWYSEKAPDKTPPMYEAFSEYDCVGAEKYSYKVSEGSNVWLWNRGDIWFLESGIGRIYPEHGFSIFSGVTYDEGTCLFPPTTFDGGGTITIKAIELGVIITGEDLSPSADLSTSNTIKVNGDCYEVSESNTGEGAIAVEIEAVCNSCSDCKAGVCRPPNPCASACREYDVPPNVSQLIDEGKITTEDIKYKCTDGYDLDDTGASSTWGRNNFIKNELLDKTTIDWIWKPEDQSTILKDDDLNGEKYCYGMRDKSRDHNLYFDNGAHDDCACWVEAACVDEDEDGYGVEGNAFSYLCPKGGGDCYDDPEEEEDFPNAYWTDRERIEFSFSGDLEGYDINNVQEKTISIYREGIKGDGERPLAYYINPGKIESLNLYDKPFRITSPNPDSFDDVMFGHITALNDGLDNDCDGSVDTVTKNCEATCASAKIDLQADKKREGSTETFIHFDSREATDVEMPDNVCYLEGGIKKKRTDDYRKFFPIEDSEATCCCGLCFEKEDFRSKPTSRSLGEQILFALAESTGLDKILIEKAMNDVLKQTKDATLFDEGNPPYYNEIIGMTKGGLNDFICEDVVDHLVEQDSKSYGLYSASILLLLQKEGIVKSTGYSLGSGPDAPKAPAEELLDKDYTTSFHELVSRRDSFIAFTARGSSLVPRTECKICPDVKKLGQAQQYSSNSLSYFVFLDMVEGNFFSNSSGIAYSIEPHGLTFSKNYVLNDLNKGIIFKFDVEEFSNCSITNLSETTEFIVKSAENNNFSYENFTLSFPSGAVELDTSITITKTSFDCGAFVELESLPEDPTLLDVLRGIKETFREEKTWGYLGDLIRSWKSYF